MTDNTPLNADGELRRIFDDDVFEIEVDGRRMNVVPFYTAIRAVEKYVLADRKKHGLRARLTKPQVVSALQEAGIDSMAGKDWEQALTDHLNQTLKEHKEE